MTEIPFYWLDVFTSKPFGGGRCVVCTFDKTVDDTVLSNIAKETELMETAFTEKIGESEYNLRWFFSDGTEAPFAGYATLAAAHTLIEEYDEKTPITFHTKSGTWTAELNDQDLTVYIPFLLDLKQVDDTRILDALELTDCVEVHYNEKMSTYVILLEHQDQVRELKPDYCRIKKVLANTGGIRLLVTAKGDEPFDFVYRFFPKNQLEDYACGSALTALGPFWKARLGKRKLRASQVHERGTDVSVEPLDEGVKLSSKARILVKGTLTL